MKISQKPSNARWADEAVTISLAARSRNPSAPNRSLKPRYVLDLAAPWRRCAPSKWPAARTRKARPSSKSTASPKSPPPWVAARHDGSVDESETANPTASCRLHGRASPTNEFTRCLHLRSSPVDHPSEESRAASRTPTRRNSAEEVGFLPLRGQKHPAYKFSQG